MNNNNNEEAIDFINRLLERLHQADFTNHGSHNINVIYVASGGQHVETQINVETRPQQTHPDPPCLGREKGTGVAFPEALSTERAMVLWKKAQDAGYVDANYQPLISRTQSALLAYEIARCIGIKEKWKVFETLWNRRNMYRDYHDALEQHQSLQFRDILKEMFQ